MTERRRGPAAPARRLAAGLSTAATLGLIAGMAAAEAPTAWAAAQSPDPVVTPSVTSIVTAPTTRRVVVVRRHHIVQQAQAPTAPTQVVTRQAPAPSRAAPAPAPAAPPPAPAPVAPQPVTSSGGS